MLPPLIGTYRDHRGTASSVSGSLRAIAAQDSCARATVPPAPLLMSMETPTRDNYQKRSSRAVERAAVPAQVGPLQRDCFRRASAIARRQQCPTSPRCSLLKMRRAVAIRDDASEQGQGAHRTTL